jgi:hypothetical protein
MKMLPFEEPAWTIEPLDLPDFAVHVQENEWVRLEESAVGEFVFVNMIDTAWRSPDWRLGTAGSPWTWNHMAVKETEIQGEPGWEVSRQVSTYDGTVRTSSRRYVTVTDQAFVLRVHMSLAEDGSPEQVSYQNDEETELLVWPRRLSLQGGCSGVPSYRAYEVRRAVLLRANETTERCIEAVRSLGTRGRADQPLRETRAVRVWYFSEDGRMRLELVYGNPALEPESRDARPAPPVELFATEWYLRWYFIAADLMPRRPSLKFS